MADNKVEYRVKISDVSGNSLGDLKNRLTGLGATVELVSGKFGDLNSKILNSNQFFQTFNNLSNSIQNISSTVTDLTSSSMAQVEAETRLQQVMRNTMGATEYEVQSIKDLAAAQQKLGVIGDEVQLAGAQELATYMSKRECLEQLVPVMNDIVAQQYGYTATAEGAVNIATMMGKVFSGQVSALSRYGYTFNEVQEQILKFGTEEEKAATLADVVEQSVGGVNQALAQTPTGKFVQLSDEIGDFKESIGAALMPFQGIITKTYELLMTTTGFVQLASSFGNCAKSIISLASGMSILSLKTKLQTVAQAALNLVSNANPYVLLGTAIAALAAGLVYLATRSSDAEKNQKKLNDAVREGQKEAASQQIELNYLFDKLKNATKGSEEYERALKQINDLYGQYLPNQLTDKSNLEQIKQAYDAVNKSLTENVMLKMKQQAIGEISQSEAGKQIEAIEKMRAALGKYNFSQTMSGDVATSLKEQVKVWQESGVSLTDAIQGAYNNVHDANGNSYANDPEVAKGISRYVESVYRMADAAKAADEKFAPFLGNLKQAAGVANQIPEIVVTGAKSGASKGSTGGDSGSGATAYVEGTIGAYTQKISELRKEQLGADMEHAKNIEIQISKLQELLDLQQKVVSFAPESQKTLRTGSPSSNQTTSGIGIPITFDTSDLEKSVNKTGKKIKAAFGQNGLFDDMQAGLKGVSKTMGALSSVVGETAGAWLEWGANVVSAIAEAIPQIIALTGTQTANAAANFTSAATGAMSSMSAIPIVGPILGIAAMASVIAAMLAIPKFAQGGLAYGPTLGLFGEYAGAQNNPEVVAPLDKLRSIIQPNDNGSIGRVTFRISGRDLEGVLAKRGKYNTRTR